MRATHFRGALDVGVGEQAVDALVDIAESFLEPHDDLAVDAETEMTGLDDAGVNRPDRDLVQAFALAARNRSPPDCAAPTARGPSGVRRPQAP